MTPRKTVALCSCPSPVCSLLFRAQQLAPTWTGLFILFVWFPTCAPGHPTLIWSVMGSWIQWYWFHMPRKQQSAIQPIGTNWAAVKIWTYVTWMFVVVEKSRDSASGRARNRQCHVGPQSIVIENRIRKEEVGKHPRKPPVFIHYLTWLLHVATASQGKNPFCKHKKCDLQRWC